MRRERNTESRTVAGLERVEVMLIRWLGYVAQMEETDIPKCLLVCEPAARGK